MNQANDDDVYGAYRDAILSRVCASCLDQRSDGSCGLTNRTCAIEQHLPRIVEAVLSVQSDRMDEYTDAIKAVVCAECAQQDPQGRCRLRDRGECALDTYLYMVVEAVDEVRARLGSRT